MVHEIALTSDITVRLIDKMGGDYSVVAAAKVSTHGRESLHFSDPGTTDKNRGLINYLMKHRHGSPFEHSALTFFVHTPIFVFREWHRHRIGFSYSEESARYKPLDPVFWIPRRDRPMMPIAGWKPGRPKFWTIDQYMEYVSDSGDSEEILKWRADQYYNREIDRNRRSYQLAYDLYRESIDDGFSMEVARCKLPVGIYSSMWVTCNPRSLMAFASLRHYDSDAKFVSYPQLEIDEACQVAETFLDVGWPITYRAFLDNGRVAP